MALTRIDSYLVDLDSLGGITFDDQAGVPTFKVDATTHRVGIGTATPTTLLDVSGTITAEAFVGNGAGITGLDRYVSVIGRTSTTSIPALGGTLSVYGRDTTTTILV